MAQTVAEAPQVHPNRRAVDRRERDVDFDRRCFDRRDRAFVFNKTVYLSDTNMVGNTYFAKYFEWQGIAREAFFHRMLVQDHTAFLAAGIKMITAEAEHKYLHEALVFQTIEIRVKVGKVRRASAELLFFFKNKATRKPVGRGRQLITFANAQGKLIPLPEIIRTNLKPFMN